MVIDLKIYVEKEMEVGVPIHVRCLGSEYYLTKDADGSVVWEELDTGLIYIYGIRDYTSAELLDWFEKDTKPAESKVEKCQCNILDLMSKGCYCGHIQRYKENFE